MFLDNNLSDEQSEGLLEISDGDRKLLTAWFDKWIGNAAVKQSGDWVQSFRPKIVSLVNSLAFDIVDGKLVIDCPPQDKATLILLARGSKWFDGVDLLELKLWDVIMSR